MQPSIQLSPEQLKEHIDMARSEKNLTAVFTDTASAIRAKTGTTEKICPLDFADRISDIETAGPGGDSLKEYIADGGRFGGSQLNYFYKYDNYLRNITDLSHAFSDSDLRAIPNINFTNVSRLDYAFSGCENMSFDHVASIVDGNPVLAKSKIVIRNMDGSCTRAFANCTSLGYIDCDITSSSTSTSLNGMFDGAKLTDIKISTTDVFDFSYMFNSLRSNKGTTDKYFNDFNSFSFNMNFTDPDNYHDLNLNGMFMSTEFMHAPLFKIPDATMFHKRLTMDYFLAYNQYLLVVPEYDLSNVGSLFGFVDGCIALEEFNAKFISASLDLSQTTDMSYAALKTVLRNLIGTGGPTLTLTLGPAYLAMLSDEDKKIAIDKGWTLA